jgi:hypothetical protein
MRTTESGLESLRRERVLVLEHTAKLVESVSLVGRTLNAEEESALSEYLNRAADLLDRIKTTRSTGG